MVNRLSDLRELLVKIVEERDKECFNLLAGFVAAVESRYDNAELIALIRETDSGEE